MRGGESGSGFQQQEPSIPQPGTRLLNVKHVNNGLIYIALRGSFKTQIDECGVFILSIQFILAKNSFKPG